MHCRKYQAACLDESIGFRCWAMRVKELVSVCQIFFLGASLTVIFCAVRLKENQYFPPYIQ